MFSQDINSEFVWREKMWSEKEKNLHTSMIFATHISMLKPESEIVGEVREFESNAQIPHIELYNDIFMEVDDL